MKGLEKNCVKMVRGYVAIEGQDKQKQTKL